MSRTEQLLCCCVPSPLAMTTATRWKNQLWDLCEPPTLPVGCQAPLAGFYTSFLGGEGSASPTRAHPKRMGDQLVFGQRGAESGEPAGGLGQSDKLANNLWSSFVRWSLAAVAPLPSQKLFPSRGEGWWCLTSSLFFLPTLHAALPACSQAGVMGRQFREAFWEG